MQGYNVWRNFLELRKGEVLRIPLPRTTVNRGKSKGPEPDMEPLPSARTAYL